MKMGWRRGSSKPAVVVVTAFEPVVAGAVVAEEDLADALQVFYTILYGNDQAEWGAVPGGQRLAAHFVGEDGLGVEHAGGVDTYIVVVVGRGETDVCLLGFL